MRLECGFKVQLDVAESRQQARAARALTDMTSPCYDTFR